MVEDDNQSQVQRPAESVRIPMEAQRLLHDLAAAWPDVPDCRALEVVPLNGVMTHDVYQVRWLTAAPAGAGGGEELKEREVRKVLLRMYSDGMGLFYDRDYELRTFECMSRHGQGPRLLGCFPNGRVEEFIHARTLSAPDLRNPEISALLARKLKEFHNLDMPGPKHVLLWDRLKKAIKTAKNMCSTDQANELCLDSLEDEINMLEKELSGSSHDTIGFCHNDLNFGNIMVDDETNVLTIIDYEYASFNPVAYDIANHFCEMAQDYHPEKTFIQDYSKYPDVDERRCFVRNYLGSSGEPHEAEEVENLLQSIEKYTLASHLFWGLWIIIMDHLNNFDYDNLDYARERFEQYWLKKPKVLTS